MKPANDSERLMRKLGETISAFYASEQPGSGPIAVDPAQALNALASMAGALVHAAPSDIREVVARDFIDDFATHAGYMVDVTLRYQQ